MEIPVYDSTLVSKIPLGHIDEDFPAAVKGVKFTIATTDEKAS